MQEFENLVYDKIILSYHKKYATGIAQKLQAELFDRKGVSIHNLSGLTFNVL